MGQNAGEGWRARWGWPRGAVYAGPLEALLDPPTALRARDLARCVLLQDPQDLRAPRGPEQHRPRGRKARGAAGRLRRAGPGRPRPGALPRQRPRDLPRASAADAPAGPEQDLHPAGGRRAPGLGRGPPRAIRRQLRARGGRARAGRLGGARRRLLRGAAALLRRGGHAGEGGRRPRGPGQVERAGGEDDAEGSREVHARLAW
mmetsp:Transcript_17092/g.53621  ORF Transcript_17092/g.53621 Transcript_17092/m.53621 type:complete len:203 (+) Transcript_17092:691-1299(+)